MASRKKSNPRKRTSKSPALRAATLAPPVAPPGTEERAAPVELTSPAPEPITEPLATFDGEPASFEPSGEELWEDELRPVAERPFIQSPWSLRASSDQLGGDLSSGGGKRQTVPLVAPKVPIADLPFNYGDDRVVLLVRDPETLYAYWDFADETAEAAGAHKPFATTHLRVTGFDGDAPRTVREIEVDLRWKGYYLPDCRPGAAYRVELLVRDAEGAEQLLGTVSDVKRLPAATPSAKLEDLFVSIAPDEPLPVDEPQVVREPASEGRFIHQRAYELSGGELPAPAAEVLPAGVAHTGDQASSATRPVIPPPQQRGQTSRGFIDALLSGRTHRRGGSVAPVDAASIGEGGQRERRPDGAAGGENGMARGRLRGGASDRGWSGTVSRR